MKITIITVTKNNRNGLLRAIECVRNQTYKNVEHIIVDGGSTDGSVGAIKNLDFRMYNSGKESVILNEMKDLNLNLDSSSATQNDIHRVDSGSESGMTGRNYQLVTVSEADSGIYDAINKGIKLATGDVIGLLHSDDLYADENVLSKYAGAFNTDSGQAGMTERIEAVYTDLVYVKAGTSKQETGNSKKTDYKSLITDFSIVRYWKTQKSQFTTELQRQRALNRGWMPPHPTLFIRKEIFNKYGLYKTDLKIASDYEMILRLLFKHKITACYLPVTTYMMTFGGASNKSLGNILQKSKEDLQAMKLHNLPFPFFTLINKNLRKLPQFLARDL